MRLVPRWAAAANLGLAVLGVGVLAVIGWLVAPHRKHVVVHGYSAYVTTGSRLPWAIAGLCVGIALLFLLAGVRVVADRASGPRLVFVGTEAADAVVITGPLGAGGGIPAGSSVLTPEPPKSLGASGPASAFGDLVSNRYVRVLVRNEPETGFGPVAEHVAGKVEFLGDDGSVLHELDGRWAGTLQRLETGRLGLDSSENEISIPANGITHSLDIAVKAPGDSHFYAFNHLNASSAQHRHEPHLLEVKACRVRVTLRASNAPRAIATFRLENDADDLRLVAESD